MLSSGLSSAGNGRLLLHATPRRCERLRSCESPFSGEEVAYANASPVCAQQLIQPLRTVSRADCLWLQRNPGVLAVKDPTPRRAGDRVGACNCTACFR